MSSGFGTSAWILTLLTLSACGGGGGGDSGGGTPAPAPSALSYPSPQTYTVGAAITPLTPAVTGAVTSYTVSPSLPAGIALNATSGVLNGTPTAATPQALYTVTASNSSGSTSFGLTIAVNAAPVVPPAALSYPSPQSYTVGSAITPLNPTVTGAVTGYSVSPMLPAGLTLDGTSGQISGTPTAVSGQATYTVSASNQAGSTSFGLIIQVSATGGAAPSGLSYASPQTYVAGVTIAPLTPTLTGTATSYSVAPALPAGLSLDVASGQITGTPAAATQQATYTVTASNAIGSTSFGLVITVSVAPVAPPTGLSYPSPQTYTVGTSITPLSPTVTGPVTSYGVVPALPAGLSLNAGTGQIAGTPSAAMPQAVYTITASNSAGSTAFGLTITVNHAPPTGLSYPSPQTYTVGTAIATLTPTVSGTVTNYGVSPSLPAGLSLDSTTGRITGTPTATTPQAVYTITASNSGGATTFGLSITVDLAAPTGLVYPSPQTYRVGTPITPLTPTVTGTVTSYGVAPNLPAGLSLNAATGQISGTPTAVTALASYLITASNAAGSTTFALTITVDAALTYTIGGSVTGLDASGLVLTNNGTDDLPIAADGAFVFDTALPSGAEYAVEAAAQPSSDRLCKVENAVGTVAGANVTNVAVVCAPPQWGTAELIAPPTGFAGNPEIAVRPDGSAVLAWWHYANSSQTSGTINLQRYAVTSGWSAPEEVVSGARNTGIYRRLAFDSAGNGFAAWVTGSATNNVRWTRRYTAGVGWGAQEALTTDTNINVFAVPQIEIDGDGNAIAVWIDGEQNNDQQAGGSARRYVPGSGWQPVEVISTVPGFVGEFDTAIDEEGNVTVVWNQQDTAGVSNLYANRYTAGSGWGSAVLLETFAETVTAPPRVAAGPNGTALAVWPQWTAGHAAVGVFVSRYAGGSGWEPPVVVSGATVIANEPRIAVDPDGNAVAVWIDNAVLKMQANRYTAASGWGTPVPLQSSTSNAVGSPDLAVNANGAAMAVWEEATAEPAAHIWASRFVPGAGWGTSTQISTGAGVAAAAPRVDIDAQGRAIAAWHQWPTWTAPSGAHVWTNRFE